MWIVGEGIVVFGRLSAESGSDARRIEILFVAFRLCEVGMAPCEYMEKARASPIFQRIEEGDSW